MIKNKKQKIKKIKINLKKMKLMIIKMKMMITKTVTLNNKNKKKMENLALKINKRNKKLHLVINSL
jgi:hypothetical protein